FILQPSICDSGSRSPLLAEPKRKEIEHDHRRNRCGCARSPGAVADCRTFGAHASRGSPDDRTIMQEGAVAAAVEAGREQPLAGPRHGTDSVKPSPERSP